MSSILDLVEFYRDDDADQVLDEHNAAMDSLTLSDPQPRPDAQVSDVDTNTNMEWVKNINGAWEYVAADPAAETPKPVAPIPVFSGPRLPYTDTRLGQLPDLIKQQIFKELMGFYYTIDLTIPRAKRGRIRLYFSRWFPHLKVAFSTFLLTCKGFREDGIDYLSSTTRFVSSYGTSARNLPTVFGAEATAMIQRFDLDSEFMIKTSHEQTWPHLLKVLVDSMPKLNRFRLISDYVANGAPYPPNETGDTGPVPRYGQERRVGLRFGAFLTLRHPVLKVLTLPAESGPQHGSNEGRVLEWIEVFGMEIRRPLRTMMKRATPDAVEETEHKDLTMNSTAIRRVKWTDLGNINPAELALPSDATTSEVAESPEDQRFFGNVDRKGYLTFQELNRKRLGRWEHVDALLDAARQAKERAAQPGGQRGRGANHRGFRGGRTRGAGVEWRGRGRGRGLPGAPNVPHAANGVEDQGGQAMRGMRGRGGRAGRGARGRYTRG